ncbi:ATP-grasp fold amidoligase family protein [Aeromonas veronii]|uniref:ATP-grasp fold amidoligase family protein n=1 Tax=Aeromonas veronii TaxID=654 RepID=UPI00191EB8CB|nr:ATP-grasp fold amidoligase family protein [Aeromonas veronii]MBL0480070.1 hypothetical protein [Aeromonas veronii]
MFLKKVFFKTLHYILSERQFFTIRYYLKQGKIPNLVSPKKFTEKLLVSKLDEPTYFESLCADKKGVREIVEKKIGSNYLIPLITSIETEEEFDLIFPNLPKQFAMKAAHGSGWNEIVFDKSKVNKNQLKRNVKKWLGDNYYFYGLEKQYKNIKPSVVFETLLVTDDGTVPYDYKFYCFGKGGKSEIIIQVDLDRFGNHQRAFYDSEWKRHPISILSSKSVRSQIEVTKPECLDEMLKIVSDLSCDFDFSRIDLYVVGNKVYFGEITFHPESAYGMIFEDESQDYRLGELIL